MIRKRKKKSHHTKTYKYLFDVFLHGELKYYGKSLYTELCKVNSKHLNAYVDDTSIDNHYWQKNEDEETDYGYIFVTISANANNLNNVLSNLPSNKSYITHYVRSESKDLSTYVIVFHTTNSIFIRAFENLMLSQYSRMYYNKNHTLSHIKDPYYYIEQLKNHFVNNDPRERAFKDSYYILTKNKEYFNTVIAILEDDYTQEQLNDM